VRFSIPAGPKIQSIGEIHELAGFARTRTSTANRNSCEFSYAQITFTHVLSCFSQFRSNRLLNSPHIAFPLLLHGAIMIVQHRADEVFGPLGFPGVPFGFPQATAPIGRERMAAEVVPRLRWRAKMNDPGLRSYLLKDFALERAFAPVGVHINMRPLVPTQIKSSPLTC
jgi:hypothetical protein